MRRFFSGALLGAVMMMGALLMGALGGFAAAQVLGGLRQPVTVAPVTVQCAAPAPVQVNCCTCTCCQTVTPEPTPTPGKTVTTEPTPTPGKTVTPEPTPTSCLPDQAAPGARGHGSCPPKPPEPRGGR